MKKSEKAPGFVNLRNLSMLALCVPGASFLTMHGSQAQMYIQGNFGYSFSGKASAEHSGETQLLDSNNQPIPHSAVRAALPASTYSSLTRPRHDFDISPSGSITGSGSAGMMFRKGLAAELEIAYYQMKQDNVTNFIANQSQSALKDLGMEAKYRNILLMANLIYNVPTQGKLAPYIGGGLGVNSVKFSAKYKDNRKGSSSVATLSSQNNFKSKSKSALAVQGILGLSYSLTEMVDITTDYRMTWTGGSITTKYEEDGATRLRGINYKNEDKLVTDIPIAHRLQAGIRFRF